MSNGNDYITVDQAIARWGSPKAAKGASAAVADEWQDVPAKATKGVPSASTADEWEDVKQTSAPTQFERERPGTGVNLEGAGTAAWEGIKAIPGAIVKQLDPTQPFRHPSEMPIVQATQEAKAGWQRGRDRPWSWTNPYGRLGEAAISGLGSLVGMSASRAAEHGERGEGGAILGETAVPLATLAAGEVLGRGVPAVRRGVGGYTHDPVTGKMTPGARLTGKIAGGAAGFLGGAALGLSTGMEHTGIAPYVGARLGAEVGPSLMERMFPEPRGRVAARAESAAYEQRAQDLMRRGKEQEALDKKAVQQLGRGEPTVFPVYKSPGPYRGPSSVPRLGVGGGGEIAEGIGTSVAKPSGRLILTPEEAASETQMQKIATKRASERGMQFAGGMVPREGRSVPQRPTAVTETEYGGPRPGTTTFGTVAQQPQAPPAGTFGAERRSPGSVATDWFSQGPPANLLKVLGDKLGRADLSEFERNTLLDQWRDLTGREWAPREVPFEMRR